MVTAPGYHAGAEEHLQQQIGPIERRSKLYDFSTYSHFYEREMGSPIWKYFLAFEKLSPPDFLVQLKLITESIEEKLACLSMGGRKRTVNLDPGYVTGWNLVLSTVKNYAHRLYLGDGVYGEVTLIFQRGAFQPLPWTYRDYSSRAVLLFFEEVRSDYLKQLALFTTSAQGHIRIP